MKKITLIATTLLAVIGTASSALADTVSVKANAVYNTQSGNVQPEVQVGYRSKTLPGVSLNPFLQVPNVSAPIVYGVDVTYDLTKDIAAGVGIKAGGPQTVYYSTVAGKYDLNSNAYLAGQVKIPTNAVYGTDLSLGLGYKF